MTQFKIKAFCYTLFIFFFSSYQLIGQSNADLTLRRKDFGSPSFAEFSFGVGANHALLGLQTVVGKNGNGLLLGIGQYKGYTTKLVGLQLFYESIYFSYARGNYSYYEIEQSDFYSEAVLWGNILMAGFKGSFKGKEKFFMQLGIGLANGGGKQTKSGTIRDKNSIVLDFGLGYRFGSGTLSPY